MDNGIVVFSAVFAAGIIFVRHVFNNGILQILFFCAFLLLLVFLIKRKSFRALAAVFLALAASFSWQFFYYHYTETPEWILGKDVELIATVSDFSHLNSKGTGVAVRATVETANGTRLSRKPRALLYISDKSASFTPGGKLRLTVNLEEPEDTKDFPAFTYYKTRYIDLIGFGNDEYTYTEPDRVPLRYLPSVASHRFKQRVDVLFSEKHAGFINALIIGDKRAMEYGFSEDIRICGLSHTVVVSGMHIAFLSGFIVVLLGRRRAAFIAIPVIIFFALMVGATSSVLRAVIMQTAFFIALWLKRERDSVNMLMLSLLVILLINPYAVSDIGLHLSFASTLGLALFSGRIKNAILRMIRTKNRFIYKITAAAAGTLDATLSATVLTVPVIMTSFKSLSLISPISNLLILFMINIIFSLGILAVLLSLFWYAGGAVIASAVGFVCWLVEFIVTRLAELPFASIYTGNAYIIVLMVYLYSLLLIFFIDTKRSIKTRVYLTCAGIAVVLTVFLLNLPIQKNEGVEIAVLNVGQGQCVSAEYKNHRVFIDCGGNLSRNAGEIAYEHLMRGNTRKADALILTHLHEDHINGCERLLSKAKITRVYIPDKYRNTNECAKITRAAQKNNSEICFVSRDDKLIFEDLVIDLFYMTHNDSENETGVSVLLRLKNFGALVTGDMSREGELMLVSEKALFDINAYIVGHHGAKSSSSLELLNVILPELSVISVGKNYYGHPSGETLNRLSAIKTVVRRTDEHGNIILNSLSFNP